MAILTDLPNELLLSIIADVSPLYIDSFILTCKRIYGLRADAIAQHAIVRSGFSVGSWACHHVYYLQRVLQDPRLALYPLHWDFNNGRDPLTGSYDLLDGRGSEDLSAAIKIQIQQSPYTALLRTSDSASNARDLVVPLLMTRLLNLRKMNIDVSRPFYLVETVSKMVEAIHDPVLSLGEPLALGRLTDVSIAGPGHSIPGMDLAVLFAMIPTLRKLSVSHLAGSEPYSCSHHFHCSEVTDMSLDDCVDSGFLIELIRRTYRLQKFALNQWIELTPANKRSRLLIESLKKHAGGSLLYLSLLASIGHIWPNDGRRDEYRNSIDMSLGPLRGFTVLKTLVTCVDMLIKTRLETGTGTVQRLISLLPASLEILVLHQGLECWDKDTLRLLFRGLRNNKQTRIPKLRFINFEDFEDFYRVMPENITNACRETGIKIGYTTHWNRVDQGCCRLYDEASNWEECDWIASLANNCHYRIPWRD